MIIIFSFFTSITPTLATSTGSLSQIATVAGSGATDGSGDGGLATAGSLNNPTGVWCDTSNNLYIAEDFNHKVRKVSASSGFLSTVAGTGTSGASGMGGQAILATLWSPCQLYLDTSANNLYISEYGNSRISVLSLSSGIITLFAGTVTGFSAGDGGKATSAVFYYLVGVYKDTAGSFYVSDLEGHRVRKIDTSNIVTTIAGAGTFGITGDGGPATSALIDTPSQLFITNTSVLYMTLNGGCASRAVTLSTGVIRKVAGTGSCISSSANGPATSVSISYGNGMSLDQAGNIGTSVGTGGPSGGDGGRATSAGLTSPVGVWIDSANNMY
eukprot:gene39195-48410_t